VDFVDELAASWKRDFPGLDTRTLPPLVRLARIMILGEAFQRAVLAPKLVASHCSCTAPSIVRDSSSISGHGSTIAPGWHACRERYCRVSSMKTLTRSPKLRLV